MITDKIAEMFGGTPRSPQWRRVRDKYVENNPKCVVCGSRKNIQVHHIIPFCVDPSKELDVDNLATMCARCHLLIGHGGWFQRYNGNFEHTVATMKAVVDNRKACGFGDTGRSPNKIVKFVQSILRRWYHF